jgi:hypothetical protein
LSVQLHEVIFLRLNAPAVPHYQNNERTALYPVHPSRAFKMPFSGTRFVSASRRTFSVNEFLTVAIYTLTFSWILHIDEKDLDIKSGSDQKCDPKLQIIVMVPNSSHHEHSYLSFLFHLSPAKPISLCHHKFSRGFQSTIDTYRKGHFIFNSSRAHGLGH